MKKAIAIFTILTFTLTTISPFLIPSSEAAITIGTRDDNLPEIGTPPHFFNLDRRNQLEKGITPVESSPQKEIPKVEPSPLNKSGVVEIRNTPHPSQGTEKDNRESDGSERNNRPTRSVDYLPNSVRRMLEAFVSLANILSILQNAGGLRVQAISIGGILSLLGGGGPTSTQSESVPSGKATKGPAVTMASAAESNPTPAATGGGDGGDKGPVVGPGGVWTYTTTFITKGKFDMRLLLKLIKWALKFVDELNRSTKAGKPFRVPSLDE